MRLDAFLSLVAEGATLAGETTDALFPEEDSKPIEILWFGQIVTRGRYENRGLGMNQQSQTSYRKQFSSISIIKPLDQTSPSLLEALCLEEEIVFETAKIETYFYRGNSADPPTDWTREPYFVIEMSNARIMRIQLVADARVSSVAGGNAEVFYQLPDDLAGVGPLEFIDFSFESISWQYKGERVTAATSSVSGIISNT